MRSVPAAPPFTANPRPGSPRGRSAKVLASLALVAGILAAGCSAIAAPAASTPAPTPAATPLATPAVPPAPVTVTDDEGAAYTFRVPPARIVSLSPAITETLFALGAGERVVGGTEADDFPAEAKALPDVASFTGVNIEAVVAARPDVVIAGGNDLTPPADIEKLRSLGLSVVVVYAGSVDAVLRDISLIGTVAGQDAAASLLVGVMRSRIDELSAAAKAAGSTPRVFYELDATKEIYGPAPDSFLTEMIGLAGGDAITSGDPAVWAVSLERLVDADPEVIILGDANYGMTPEAVKSRPGWAGMTAVKAGAILPIDGTVVTRPGPRIITGLEALVRAIHPDVELP
jgi:iron complex transport system substrate-binding protein